MITIFGRRNRRALRQVRLLTAVLAVRAVRRLAGEAGVGAVDRRWLVTLGAAAALLVTTSVGVLGVVVGSLAHRTDTGPTVLLGVLSTLALAGPWLVGTLGVAPAAATHVDPSHTLFRPALVSAVVPVISRTALPALVKAVTASLLVVALAAPTLHTAGRSPLGVTLLAAAAVAYAVVVTAARVLLLGLRLRAVAQLRRGRLGLPLILGTVLVQAAAAFLVPHLLLRLAPRPGLGAVIERVGREALSLSSTTTALVAVILAGLAVPTAALSVRALDRGLTLVERELRSADARTRDAAACAPDLPLDPVRALVAKDVRRARRAAGPLVGPALTATAWGCVLASGLLGLVTSGLMPGRDNPLALGFQLLVAALVAIEFASTGLLPVTSPDADGYAARAVLATPDGRRRSARAKAGLHASLLSAVAVVTLGVLALVVDLSLGGVLALVALLVGGVVLSTLEHVGAPAVHPRLDWTTIEQIGGNPRAQALGLTVSVAGFAVLNTVAVALARLDLRVPLRTLVLAGLVAVAALASPPLARSTTALFVRRLS